MLRSQASVIRSLSRASSSILAGTAQAPFSRCPTFIKQEAAPYHRNAAFCTTATTAKAAMSSSSSIPSTMKAIVIDEQGGPEVMQLKEIPVPKPGKGEVLIKVEYSGCVSLPRNMACSILQHTNSVYTASTSLTPTR